MIRYSLTIEQIRKETEDAITICFKQPSLRKIKYKAGQFITLIVKIKGRKYARPYSFSSAPNVDARLEITVKKVPNGIVSNYINNELNVGDVLEVLEPMGDFTYEIIDPHKPIYLWGVGSGITPLFSIIKEALNTQSDPIIHLVYGNKNKKSTIFREQLKVLNQKYSSSFSITNFYSQLHHIYDDEITNKGRISSDFVKHFLNSQDNIKNSVHYVCGPKDLKDTIQSALIELNVPLSSIFIEEFEKIIDPKMLDGVEDSRVSINFKEKLHEIFVQKGNNILDVALDNDIEIPYSCQTGNCSVCKAKLIKGQLKMIGINKDRKDLKEDEFLLCCSYPLISSVCIEII